jgi:lipopolysaccharide/colanic/teichoic acid biosynthesis glycosyltransferase
LVIKRIFDFTVSLIGLIILSPAFLLIAICIKLDSEGPVFFRQERIGYLGTPFRILKFRTMTGAASGLPLTVGDDIRITKYGRFLRKFKLDELPQLINVLKGDMSLVGPRPEVPRYVAAYPEDVKKFVLSVRPGITDFAAIEFKDENEILRASTDPEKDYLEKILPRKLAYYQEYVRRRSLLLDMYLIFRTLASLYR